MKLLFDQNLSQKLVASATHSFPGSAHVKDFQPDRAQDQDVWQFAKENGFAIVSKDEDFRQRSFLFGAPPKVVWLCYGNCTTREIADALSHSETTLHTFNTDKEAAFLVLSREQPVT